MFHFVYDVRRRGYGVLKALHSGSLLGKHSGSRSVRHELVHAEHIARSDRQLGTLRRIAMALGCMGPPRRRRLPLAHLPAERAPENVPALVLVLLVCGTRGDVQPFIAMGLKLQDAGHRVRLATHSAYRGFVEGFGLEFYPLGGDPVVLSQYIVKHRGIFPTSMADVVAQRAQLRHIIYSCWPACTAPDPGHPTPFHADAIIANPVSYAHVHVAEALGCPLHLCFTMPYSRTGRFPHPLARILYQARLSEKMVSLSEHASYQASVEATCARLLREGRRRDVPLRKLAQWRAAARRRGASLLLGQIEAANRMSYRAVEDLTHSGMADILDGFRKTIGLPSLRGRGYATAVQDDRVPFMYCFSTHLVPKPKDWGVEIDITGFCFLDVAQRTGFEPPTELREFLAAGPPPVYFGWGSLMVDDPNGLTAKIHEAAAAAGVRAIISRGWGGLGELAAGAVAPADVLSVGSVPHDWLFPQCLGVVHHGGAGTTASGLLAGCPTTVVYIFGDQPFWGEAVATAGVGPKPISIDRVTTKKLAAALRFMAQPEVKQAAVGLGRRMQAEDGAAAAVDAFHRHLPSEFLAAQRLSSNVMLQTLQRHPAEGEAGVQLDPSGADSAMAAVGRLKF
ncbi:hypothetical protein WJX81_002671 [Elliptochloris bilobata]|uniref:Glycosyltransferase family 28 N-terminal domain-containing protein n=1 Tax=Elliptochloris bilobata TaxID=381761 RepID=A0AAW1RQY3_9CHLO